MLSFGCILSSQQSAHESAVAQRLQAVAKKPNLSSEQKSAIHPLLTSEQVKIAERMKRQARQQAIEELRARQR
jgi:hypothetical protein